MNTPILMISYEAPPRLSAESILAGKTLKALADVQPDGPVIDLVCASPGDEVPSDGALEGLLPATLRVHRIAPAPQGRKTLLQRIIGGKGGWQKAAVAKSRALFPSEQKKPAVLYSRSHPPASHLAALELLGGPLQGVPWVAHFSDPWSQHAYYRSPVTRAALRRYERQILQQATRLVFVSETLRGTMLDKESDEIRAKARVIPHLFDASLYAKSSVPAQLLAPPAPAGAKVLAHVGDLYGLRSPAPLFEACGKMAGAGAPAPLLLWLAGRIDPAFAGLEERFGISAQIRHSPPVPYLQSLAVMAAADVLVTVEADVKQAIFFPSKLVDYLGARKPLFAITPKGSLTSQLMERWRQPWCDVKDIGGIADVLKRAASGELWAAPDESVLAAYSPQAVGSQLAALLAEARG